MQHTRHYYGYKTAKDYLMLYNQTEFTKFQVETMFKSRSILNYMNDLVLDISKFSNQLIKNISEDDLSLVGLDISLFFQSEMLLNRTINYYLEALTDFDDWDNLPIIKNKSLEYFEVDDSLEQKFIESNSSIKPLEKALFDGISYNFDIIHMQTENKNLKHAANFWIERNGEILLDKFKSELFWYSHDEFNLPSCVKNNWDKIRYH